MIKETLRVQKQVRFLGLGEQKNAFRYGEALNKRLCLWSSKYCGRVPFQLAQWASGITSTGSLYRSLRTDCLETGGRLSSFCRRLR